MSELKLSFLGPPLITRDGEGVALKPRKSLALVVYLAVTATRHGRDALAGLLYPGLDRERARAGVRQCLSILRANVGEEWIRADADSIWISEGQGLWLDVRELRVILERDPSRSLTLAREAERLFRGEFLQGFSLRDSAEFDAWQRLQEESLGREHVRLMATLVTLHHDQGMSEEAIGHANRWLSLDPSDEAAHRALMRLYAVTDRRTEALRQYARCRKILRLELDSVPDTETEALRREIQEGRTHRVRATVDHDRPASARPGNLRSELTSFVGREGELAFIVETLRREAVRIVTLTGTGGTGKTRLAREAARVLQPGYAQGVFFIDLAALGTPAQVIPAIAATLRLQEAARDGRALLEVLIAFLEARQVLLLCDNFEHVLEAAVDMAEVVAACAGVKVLATSREPLGVRGETEISVPPLGLPPEGQHLTALRGNDAIRLFEERAAAALPGFCVTAANAEVVRRICARLDGLPLAIELAAARVKAFPLPTLLDLLDRRLEVLRDGARDLPARQRTLQGEIDWSYALLDAGDQRLFRCLSVFPGGCTIESAAAVALPGIDELAVGNGLRSLANKSLLRQAEVSGAVRFRMLDTIREYAAAKLDEAGETGSVLEGYTAWYLALAERAEPELYRADQRRWLDLIEAEYDNIVSALSWLDVRGKHPELLRLAASLGWFWFRRARFREGAHWLGMALEKSGDVDDLACLAKATYYLAEIKQMVADIYFTSSEALDGFEKSLQLYRRAGDLRGTARSMAARGVMGAFPRSKEATGNSDLTLMDQSVALARQAGDPWVLSWCLKVCYAFLWRSYPAKEERRAALEESIALARRTGDPYLLREALEGMGGLFWGLGEHAAAVPWYEEALQRGREIDDRASIPWTMHSLSDSYLALGEISKARSLQHEAFRMAADVGARSVIPIHLRGLSTVARAEGKTARAARLMACAVALGRPGGGFPPGLAAEAGLDESAARAELQHAASMTLPQIVEYALSDSEDPPPGRGRPVKGRGRRGGTP